MHTGATLFGLMELKKQYAQNQILFVTLGQ
jgi:hypothetical protein